MTEVMFEVVTFGFQGIITFIFNLLPRPPRSNHFCHLVIVNCQGDSEYISRRISWLTFEQFSRNFKKRLTRQMRITII